MRRLIVSVLLLIVFGSCSKKEYPPIPPSVIPDVINGFINEITLTPLNITTPDKGSFSISSDNTIYKVEFNATDQAKSNATFRFASDTVLINSSREFANLGKDAVAYNPVASNQIEIRLTDGKKVVGLFHGNTSFGGEFGEQLIAQWRTPADPAKPNQKAKDDITNLIRRYADKDGPGPGTAPVYLSVTVSKP